MYQEGMPVPIEGNSDSTQANREFPVKEHEVGAGLPHQLVGPPPDHPRNISEYPSSRAPNNQADTSFIDSLAAWREQQGRVPTDAADWGEVEKGARQPIDLDNNQYTHNEVPFGGELERLAAGGAAQTREITRPVQESEPTTLAVAGADQDNMLRSPIEPLHANVPAGARPGRPGMYQGEDLARRTHPPGYYPSHQPVEEGRIDLRPIGSIGDLSDERGNTPADEEHHIGPPAPEGVSTLLNNLGSGENTAIEPAVGNDGLTVRDRVILNQLGQLGQSISDEGKKAQFTDAVEGVFAHRMFARESRDIPVTPEELNKEAYRIYREKNISISGTIDTQRAAADQVRYMDEARNSFSAQPSSEAELSDAVIVRIMNSPLIKPVTDEEARSYIRELTTHNQRADAFNTAAIEEARKKIAEEHAINLGLELEKIGNSRNWKKLLDSRYQSIIEGKGPSAEELVNTSAEKNQLEPRTINEQKGFLTRFLDRIRGINRHVEEAVEIAEILARLPKGLWEQIPHEQREILKNAVQKASSSSVRTLREIAAAAVTNKAIMGAAGGLTGAAISATVLLRVPEDTRKQIAFDAQNWALLGGLTALSGIALEKARQNEGRHPRAAVAIGSFARGLTYSMMVGSMYSAVRLGAPIGHEIAQGIESTQSPLTNENIPIGPVSPGETEPHHVIVGPEDNQTPGAPPKGEVPPVITEQRFESFGFTVHGPYQDAFGTHSDNSWHEIQTSLEPGGAYSNAVGIHWEAPSGVTKEDVMTNFYESRMGQYGHQLDIVNTGDRLGNYQLTEEQRSSITHDLELIANTNSYAEYQQIQNQLGLAA
jgi:hypothetical protein